MRDEEYEENEYDNEEEEYGRDEEVEDYNYGLEGEYDGDPPEGYESWAEWYYYHGESEPGLIEQLTEKLENLGNNASEIDQEKLDAQLKKADEENRELKARAKREGVHPDMYRRTDQDSFQWVQHFHTWLYHHPLLYNVYMTGEAIAILLGVFLIIYGFISIFTGE